MPHEISTTITVAKSVVTVVLSTISACECWFLSLQSMHFDLRAWLSCFVEDWLYWSLCCSGVAETELEQYSSVLHQVKCSALCAISKHLELVAPRVWRFLVASVKKKLEICFLHSSIWMAIMPLTKAMILAFAHLGRSYPAQQTWDHVPVWKGRKAHDRHDYIDAEHDWSTEV